MPLRTAPTINPPPALVSERCRLHQHEDPDHEDRGDGEVGPCPGPPAVVCACGCHKPSTLFLLKTDDGTHYMRRERAESGRAVAWCDPYVQGTYLAAFTHQATCVRCDAKRYACEEVMG